MIPTDERAQQELALEAERAGQEQQRLDAAPYQHSRTRRQMYQADDSGSQEPEHSQRPVHGGEEPRKLMAKRRFKLPAFSMPSITIRNPFKGLSVGSSSRRNEKLGADEQLQLPGPKPTLYQRVRSAFGSSSSSSRRRSSELLQYEQKGDLAQEPSPWQAFKVRCARGGQYVAETKIGRGVAYAGGQCAKGAQYAGRKCVSGAKFVGRKGAQGAFFVGRKGKEGAQWVGRQAVSRGKATYSYAKWGHQFAAQTIAGILLFPVFGLFNPKGANRIKKERFTVEARGEIRKAKEKPSRFTRVTSMAVSAVSMVAAIPFALVMGVVGLVPGGVLKRDAKNVMPKTDSISKFLLDAGIRNRAVRWGIIAGAVVLGGLFVTTAIIALASGVAAPAVLAAIAPYFPLFITPVVTAVAGMSLFGIYRGLTDRWNRQKVYKLGAEKRAALLNAEGNVDDCDVADMRKLSTLQIDATFGDKDALTKLVVFDAEEAHRRNHALKDLKDGQGYSANTISLVTGSLRSLAQNAATKDDVAALRARVDTNTQQIEEAQKTLDTHAVFMNSSLSTTVGEEGSIILAVRELHESLAALDASVAQVSQGAQAARTDRKDLRTRASNAIKTLSREVNALKTQVAAFEAKPPVSDEARANADHEGALESLLKRVEQLETLVSRKAELTEAELEAAKQAASETNELARSLAVSFSRFVGEMQTAIGQLSENNQRVAELASDAEKGARAAYDVATGVRTTVQDLIASQVDMDATIVPAHRSSEHDQSEMEQRLAEELAAIERQVQAELEAERAPFSLAMEQCQRSRTGEASASNDGEDEDQLSHNVLVAPQLRLDQDRRSAVADRQRNAEEDHKERQQQGRNLRANTRDLW